MKLKYRKIILFCFLFTLIILNSCIFEEFKFENVRLKDEWEIEVISPLFFGTWNLNDLLLEKYDLPQNNNDIKYNVLFPGDSVKQITEKSLLQNTSVIDSFNFYIDGEDYLKNAALIFEVENEIPLDFVLQIRFYNKSKISDAGATFSPKLFSSAEIQNGILQTILTKDTLVFNNNQLEVFKESDRVEFTTRFLLPDAENKSEQLFAQSEIKFSISVKGLINREYD